MQFAKADFAWLLPRFQPPAACRDAAAGLSFSRLFPRHPAPPDFRTFALSHFRTGS